MDFEVHYRSKIATQDPPEVHAHDFWGMVEHMRSHVEAINAAAFRPIVDASVVARLILGDVCAFELGYSEAVALAEELCGGDPRHHFYTGNAERVARAFMCRARKQPI